MTISAASMLTVSAGDGYEQKTSNAKAKGDSQSTIPFAQLMNQKATAGREPVLQANSLTQETGLSSVGQSEQPLQKQSYDQLTDSHDQSSKASVLTEDEVEAAVKAVGEISDGIKEVIVEETGISEEELESAMEALGVTYLDLLNPQVLEQVVVSLEDVSQEVELLTAPEELVGQLMPQIEEVTVETLTDNGISLEGFREFLQEVDSGELELPEDVAGLLPTQDLTEDNSAGLFNDVPTVQSNDMGTQAQTQLQPQPQLQAQTTVVQTVEIIHISDDELLPDEGSLSVTESIVKDSLLAPEELVMEEQPEEGLPIEEMVSRDGLMADEVFLPDENTTDFQKEPGLSEHTDLEAFVSKGNQETLVNQDNQGSQGSQDQAFSKQGGNPGQANVGGMESFQGIQPDQNPGITSTENSFAQTLQEASAPLETYTSAQTSDIINQIVSSASTTITETVSRMEMELNPQNLGRMIMQVQQEGDAVTARLIAQNENVKNALETQMMQLRQSLEAKGIKVDAVEVSVGTHEFERNLEEGMAQQQFNESGNEGQQGNGRGQMRNLNRDELDDLTDELTEEEELAAAIMRDNGGTVDYSA